VTLLDYSELKQLGMKIEGKSLSKEIGAHTSATRKSDMYRPAMMNQNLSVLGW
jgi:hypothetical protein